MDCTFHVGRGVGGHAEPNRADLKALRRGAAGLLGAVVAGAEPLSTGDDAVMRFVALADASTDFVALADMGGRLSYMNTAGRARPVCPRTCP